MSDPNDDVSPADVRGMVAEMRPDWTVRAVDPIAEGTEFVARLAVETGGGEGGDEEREAVLKTTTADLVEPEVARAEPRLLALIGRETTIPVPDVFGHVDEHDTHPAPFSLSEHLVGENYEGRSDDLPVAARERICGAAGRHLSELHGLGPLDAAGRVGVADGELAVLGADDPDADRRRREDPRLAVLDHAESTLDALADGGHFPEMADEPDRFADLVPALREHLRDRLPDLPGDPAPTYCHLDYRYGNLLLDGDDPGEVRAVLDWANLVATDPAYNLASAESLLLSPDRDDEPTERLRERLRGAYDAAGGTVDDAVASRIEAYRLVTRLDAMACLPLWHRDGTAAERDERAADHRAFVESRL